MPFEREQVEILRRRLREPPHTMHAVFGPRQTGKTTIAEQALHGIEQASLYVAVDDPGVDMPIGFGTGRQDVPLPGVRNESWLVRIWEEARREAERAEARGGAVLVLDEIQKIPEWSSAVKGLWDADRRQGCPLHVVLLGSAPLLMQSGLNESLAGRFQPIPAGHWSFREMAEAFGIDLRQYVFHGGYPGAARWIRQPSEWRRHVRQALVEPTIEKDVVGIARIEKPALLRRLLELGAACSGQILSLEKIQGQLSDRGNLATLDHYLKLLSQVGLLAGVPAFSPSPSRKAAASPKLVALNTAVMTALSDYSFEEAQADRSFWGRITESAVGAHLLNTADDRTKVHYWRARNGDEVDFVMTRGPRIVAVEVKSGAKAKPTRAMHAFRERFKPDRTLLVAFDDTEPGAVPLAEFLSRPAHDWFEDDE